MSGAEVLTSAGLVVFGYLVGSLSPSVSLGRAFKGKDIREHGSGNAGTTNAFRVFGWKLGLLVLAADMAKGAVPVVLAKQFTTPLVTVFVALACVLGHNYSLFLRGRGGKGVATGAGAALGMMPIPMVILIGVFGLLLVSTRVVSIASITCTILLPVFAVVFKQPLPYIVVFSVMSVVVLWAHRGNMVRLWRRTESRATFPWNAKDDPARGRQPEESISPPSPPLGTAEEPSDGPEGPVV